MDLMYKGKPGRNVVFGGDIPLPRAVYANVARLCGCAGHDRRSSAATLGILIMHHPLSKRQVSGTSGVETTLNLALDVYLATTYCSGERRMVGQRAAKVQDEPAHSTCCQLAFSDTQRGTVHMPCTIYSDDGS